MADIKKIIDGAINGQSYFITGPAGVGKTYTIKKIYEELKMQNIPVALASTTGINALNLGGITVHKLFGLTNRSDKGYIGFMKSSFLFRGIGIRLNKLKVIIIDEVSMLRADTFELINEILKQVTGLNKPFGGKSLIFTGDFYQIPPVVKNFEAKKTQWLFQSPDWINGNIKIVLMNEIFRQKEEKFIHFLQNIRLGKWNKQMEEIVEQCKKNKNLNDDNTKFFSTNEECDAWNKKKIDEIKGKEFTFIAEIHGKRNKKYAHDKETMSKYCIAKEELKLKVGTKVISIINDKDGEYVNGSIGIVKSLFNEPNKQYAEVLFENNKLIKIKKHLWVKQNFSGKKVATMKQMPLIPAYALTIHKSQGMTLDKAIVDCKNIFASGQMYVALSRVKTLEGLKIVNFNKKNIIVNKDVEKFYHNIK